ncbi:MAG: hypothetical protein K5859_06750 [Atopobiaceae bacterium]|nr:hypothetical protein [Atopobiaceae bacterium]
MDYSAANTALWTPIIQLGYISVALLAAYGLCRVVPAIRKSMVPAAVIAGFVLLAFKLVGVVKIDSYFMEGLTYHGITIGFIALTLRVPEKSDNDGSLTGLRSGAIVVSTYMVQGFVGLGITILLALTIMPNLFPASGILLPMGYGQGPGQANNIGTSYESLGFVGGRSFGVAIAAAGYLCACIVGVIYVNYLARKGKVSAKDPGYVSGSLSVKDFETEGEVPVSESVDRLSIQMVLVLAVYLATFLAIRTATSLLAAAAPGVANTLNPLLWGFNFIFGSGLAIVMRLILKALRSRRLMTQQYQNNYLLSRISGFAFDIMIVSAISTIEVSDLRGLWLPFVLLVVAGAALTLVHLRYVCKKVYPGYYYEGLVSMYGMMTGTISSGVLLLREIDPLMKTPAANNLVLGSSFGIVLGAPILILVGLAARSMGMAALCMVICAAYYGAMMAIILFAGKKR